jgi:lysophospholipase L1-like esterase
MWEQLGRRAILPGVIVLSLLALPARADEKGDNSAIKPEPRKNKEGQPDKGWMNRHKQFVQMAQKGGIDVLFLGDSITDAWGGEGHGKNAAGNKIFVEEFMPLHAANFGIGGDRTQHVLWRIENGELKGIQPKVIMLMIGTNNLGANTAGQIADGIKTIVKEIHQRCPKTKVLLLGIFPRGAKPNPQRDKIKQINTIIAKLDDGGKTVKYLDIGGKFLESDDTISRDIMPDYLHLSPKGYRIWADAVKEPINELLGKK